MRDIADRLTAWLAADVAFAVATVARTWKSAPRQPGASMAVATTGEVVGSVSGGCVEGAVYEVARDVLASGRPEAPIYGVSDGDAFEVGLTCGGTIELLVQPADPDHYPELPAILDAISSGQPIGVATVLTPQPDQANHHLVIRPDSTSGTLGLPKLDTAVALRAQGLLSHGSTGVVAVCPDGRPESEETEVFVQTFIPPPRMLVFGAIDFAAAVTRMGKFLGYHVILCDARPVFATPDRFPAADEVVIQWPHRYLDSIELDDRTVICVLTHDPKFDIPLLERVLRLPARYIGAMGSRRTHEERLRRLREKGLNDAELDRLSSPIGLDLGARTPEETAVAIAAEIIALSWGGSGQRLATTDVLIHH